MSEKIDLFEQACAINAGQPQEVTLRGHDLMIRRNYTAKEVHKIIRLYGPEVAEQSLDTVLTELVDLLSISSEEEKAAFVKDMLQLSLPEFSRVHVVLTQIAGVRGEDGNFLTAAAGS